MSDSEGTKDQTKDVPSPSVSSEKPQSLIQSEDEQQQPKVKRANSSRGAMSSSLDECAPSPIPSKRRKVLTKRVQSLEDSQSISGDSCQNNELSNTRPSLQNVISELNRTDLSPERRDALLESLSSKAFLEKYRDRAELFKKLVQHQIDHKLLNMQPVPESVPRCFQRIFFSIQSTPISKSKTMDLLFDKLNDCLSDGKSPHIELASVLSSNESVIASHGAYMLFVLRLAALRQLAGNGFSAFYTLCYLIEIIRQCLCTDVPSVLMLITDEGQFDDAVKMSEAALVQLAFSMSKYGLSLPNPV